jgi:hypothetical protein
MNCICVASMFPVTACHVQCPPLHWLQLLTVYVQASRTGAVALAHLVWLQVGFLPDFLSVLSDASADPTHPLHGKIDFTNLGAAGHSRGAKIAALHFAGRWCLLGCVGGHCTEPGGGSEHDTCSFANRSSLTSRTVPIIGIMMIEAITASTP